MPSECPRGLSAMADLTAADRSALDLCAADVDCPACKHRADMTVSLIEHHVALTRGPVHELMRLWTQRAHAFYMPTSGRQALRDVVDDLRQVVGHEDPP